MGFEHWNAHPEVSGENAEHGDEHEEHGREGRGNMTNRLTILLYLSFLILHLSCLPTTVKSLRLYERDSGLTIHLVLTKPKYNQGTIYTPQASVDQESEIFDGEYHIHGKKYQPDPRYQTFMNEAKSVAEEYGFGKNSDAKPVGTGIIIGDKGTVIEIIFYDIQGELKSGDGIGRDNNGKYYRVYLSEEET